jgi:hypothetical protein
MDQTPKLGLLQQGPRPKPKQAPDASKPHSRSRDICKKNAPGRARQHTSRTRRPHAPPSTPLQRCAPPDRTPLGRASRRPRTPPGRAPCRSHAPPGRAPPRRASPTSTTLSSCGRGALIGGGGEGERVGGGRGGRSECSYLRRARQRRHFWVSSWQVGKMGHVIRSFVGSFSVGKSTMHDVFWVWVASLETQHVTHTTEMKYLFSFLSLQGHHPAKHNVVKMLFYQVGKRSFLRLL